jgi:predicted ester cyclase
MTPTARPPKHTPRPTRIAKLVALAWLASAATPGAAAPPETHCDTPAEQANLKRYLEFADQVLNAGAPDRAESFYAPDFTWHDAPDDLPPGAAPMRHLLGDLRRAFPDLKVTTAFVLCAGDLLMTRQQLTGTGTGPFLGHAASGKPLQVWHTETYRFANGRLVAQWGENPFKLASRAAGWTLAWPGDLPAGTPLPPSPPLRSRLPNAPDAQPAPPGNLGHPTLLRCDGDEALLASYYDLFDNLWLGRKVAQIERWVDADFSLPMLPPGAPRGPQLLAKFVDGVRAAFPKRHIFNDVVLCGDGIVSARQTVVAINDGPYLGKPPSHRVTLVTWTDTYRFRNGKVYETYAADGDTIDTARQLGWVLLAPGETRPALEPIAWIDRYPHAK